jgi:hypothetical protein
MNLEAKAGLKPPHLTRWRDCQGTFDIAKRLDCGAFTAAFGLQPTAGRFTEKTRAMRPCAALFLALLFVIPPAAAAATEPASDTNSPVVYSLGNGLIEIKPRLKYELFLSLHVLRTAEDHHRLFVPWAQQLRATLAPETLRQATNFNAFFHEWWLCSLVQNYDGPDTIEGILDYLRQDPDRFIFGAASQNQEALRQCLGGNPKQAGSRLADFLNRYYLEGFGPEWPEHRKLIDLQAAADVRKFEQLPFSITRFMEQHTGRKFVDNTRVIFYPSSFSRPQHAYGFSEKDAKVVVYKVGESPVDTAFHELLHPLLRGWREPARMQRAIAAVGREPLFEADYNRTLRGSYGYPGGALEELIVHSTANYLSVKAGRLTKAAARRQSPYSSYDTALYDALFDRYESFPVIDDFIYYALTHIQATGTNSDSRFVYIQEKNRVKNPDERRRLITRN